MTQYTMFGADDETPQKYNTTIKAPIYAPRGIKPHILFLCDDSKTKRLVREIDESNLSDEEKQFMRLAAQRHSVFHYEKIADYYANASNEMQHLMEKSALIIIDFEKAIENGFVNLCEQIKNQYMEEEL